ncbi:MAG: hypothetical protein DMD88_09300 [Candidatus Rokuibacteriota bacterium]|nr:MAG: hypothetical protein DMD88_09300 [Candidatus Rokubacteria bacterium]
MTHRLERCGLGHIVQTLERSHQVVTSDKLWITDIPRNSGTYRPTSIVAPEGSLVNPRAPAPTTMCSSTRLTRGPRSSSGMAPASASTPSAWSGDASRVSENRWAHGSAIALAPGG